MVNPSMFITSSHPLDYCSHALSLSFQEHTRLFNGNVLNTSKAVVLPLDAQDVSEYEFSLSSNFAPADIFAEQSNSVTNTNYRRPSRPAGMAQVVGRSMAILSSTYPTYKTSISNRRSEKAMGTPASATPPRPLARVKHASANPYPTCLVPPHESTSLTAWPSKPRRAPTPCPSHGCTVPHPSQLQAFCTGLRCCLIVLARNPVVYRSTAEVSASMAACLRFLRSLLLERRPGHTPIVLP